MTPERPRRWVVAGTIVVLLAVLWVLLWGTFSWGNLLNGLLLGAVVTTVFPLPDARVGGRLHVGALLAFVGRFAVDVVIASGQVAWIAVRPGPPPVSSVVSVDVRSSSELILTVLTEALSLVPGSLVIEVDTRSSTIVAHVLEARDDAAVARFKARVRDVEAQIIRALGTPDDLALLAEERSRS
ncbi:Na+/H+ antiporter subunit E [Aquipuribacter sp. MA13-6]|uniref:Na+/H+ antiporter subunit E n=1 Tax=unclassified Aquipuribacter TaxID=2635084 RepID=UPI003EEA5E81